MARGACRARPARRRSSELDARLTMAHFEAMRHGLMYQGGFERNHPSLAPGTASFVGTDGRTHQFPEWPADVDGVRFGYLERRGKRFVVARVQFEEHDV